MALSTSSNFAKPDDAFRAVVEAHRGLSDGESADLDAALVLILANHQSNLDPIFIGLACDRRLNYLARQSLFGNMALGWLIRSLDAIPMLAVTKGWRAPGPCTTARRSTPRRMRSATAMAPASLVSGKSTANSSPPMREPESSGRPSIVRTTRAIEISVPSPAPRPK